MLTTANLDLFGLFQIAPFDNQHASSKIVFNTIEKK
jgi:hypothetical protein